MNDCAHLVEVLMTMMDYDKNVQVNRKEFNRACAEMPFVLANFESILAPTARARRLTRELGHLMPHFTA